MKILDKELLNSNIDKIAHYDISENNIWGSAYIVKQKGVRVRCKQKKISILAQTDSEARQISTLLLCKPIEWEDFWERILQR